MTPARLVGESWYPTPPATLAHLLIDAANRAPAAEALVCGDRRLSYSEYLTQAAGLARYLQHRELKGERIALLLGNSIEMAIASFAVHMAGAQAVLLNPAYTARELALILADAQPALLIHHRSGSERVASIASWNGPDFVVEDGSFDDLASEPAAISLPEPDSPATLQYTGGTTGRPKGVNLTHRAIATNIAQREALLATNKTGERILCVTPLFHSYATAMGLHLAAFCTGTLVILPKYSAEATLMTIERERITIFPGSPTILLGLMSHPKFKATDFSSIRLCYSGSAALPEEVLKRWENAVGCRVYEGYGQTEAGPVLTYNSPSTGVKAGSVGVALPATTIEIVDLERGEIVLEAGQSGEVRAKGPQIMSGYRNAVEETNKTLRCGWLYTGDIGSIDTDGTLTIRGRKKEMAIVGGFNVFPREIEDVLLMHPAVVEAAAIGVPDSYRGEVIHAFVVATNTNEQALIAYCGENLVRYKVPAAIELVSELPKTTVGKVDKLALLAKATSSERK
jgi:long-chain acyl-CoA synthetase